MGAFAAFDTARFEELLLENELTPRQARGVRLAVAEALRTAAEPLVDEHRLSALDTKMTNRFDALEAKFTASIENQGSVLRQALAEAGRDQSRWTGTLVIGALTLNLAAVAGVGIALYNALS